MLNLKQSSLGMKIFLSQSQDPYFNIAAEEYLLNHTTDDILFLYVNKNSVIVGKHQNLLAEINYRYTIENQISLVRRISGGGTVYHDTGNLNYAFINNSTEGYQVNFSKYLLIIQKLLSQFNIDSRMEGKNDLRVNGLKISGNAGHVYKNRVLHHGTLLVSANLEKLSRSLLINENRYFSKAVPSIRSRVANLNQFNPHISIDKIIDAFSRLLRSQITVLPEIYSNFINDLIKTKFIQWHWIFGYSPDYIFESHSNYFGKIKLMVEKGIIKKAEIENFNELSFQLTNKPHEHTTLKSLITEDADNLVWHFF